MSCGVVHQIILSKYQLLRRIMWKVPVQTFGFNERLRSKPALFSHPRQAWTAESVSDWMMFAKHLWNSQLPPLNTPQHTPTTINCTRTTGLLRPPWHGLLFMVKSTQNSIGVLRRSQKLSNCPIAHNPIFDRHFPSSISQWKTPKTAKKKNWAPNFEVPIPQKVPPQKKSSILRTWNSLSRPCPWGRPLQESPEDFVEFDHCSIMFHPFFRWKNARKYVRNHVTSGVKNKAYRKN